MTITKNKTMTITKNKTMTITKNKTMTITNNKTISSKTNRLDSIKAAHGNKESKSKTRKEDYLEVILELVELKGYATPSAISNYMNVSPPSVTKMLQKLAKEGYLDYTKYRGLRLKKKGKNLANEIQQKHNNLLEFFKLIGIEGLTANRDIEGIEHHLNPQTIKQLKKLIFFLKSHPSILTQFNDAQ